MNRNSFVCFAVSLFLCWSVTFVYADEIEDEIKSALSSYQKGEYTRAISSLEFATQQIRQMKAEKIDILFPQPLKGWHAGSVERTAAGRMILGGMISGSRKYFKQTSTVDINITTDNPMIAFLSGVISNPVMISMASEFGGTIKIIKVKGRRAIAEWKAEERRGSIKMILDNRVLVVVNGNNCRESDIYDYAEAIDYDKIKEFAAE